MNQRAQTGKAPSSSPASSVQKQFIIGAIAVVAVVVLALFIRQAVVGKAIQLPAGVFNEGEGGVIAPLNVPLPAGSAVTVSLGARLPASKESVAFSITVTYDPNLVSFENADSRLADGWSNEFLRTNASTANTVVFEHATIDFTKAISSGVQLAGLNFKALQDLTETNIGGAIMVTAVEVLDLSPPHANLITGPLTQVTGANVCSAAACPTLNEQYASAVLSERQTLFGSLTTEERQTICLAYGLTPAECPADGTFTIDINGDGVINGQDAYIILKAAEAKVRDECGAATQTPCAFGATYTCDDGSFRVDGYKRYVYAAVDSCPYLNTAGYIQGG